MVVESVQCPQCGAPLQVTRATRETACAYCGSSVRITKGLSGHPVAVPGDIKADTGLIARDVACRRLVERATTLRHQRNALREKLIGLDARRTTLQEEEAKLAAEYEDERRQYEPEIIGGVEEALGTVLVIVFALIGSACFLLTPRETPAGVFLALMAIAIACATVRSRRKRLRRQLKYQGLPTDYEPRIRQLSHEASHVLQEKSGVLQEVSRLSEEISHIEQRIETIKAEMDDLSETL